MSSLNNIINLYKNPEEINFWINDVGLFIPPSSISVHKEGLSYSTKTLRTRTSTKISTGNGVMHIQVGATFGPDSLLQMHRIITQVRNNPFVYVENSFIQKSIDPIKNNRNVHCTVIGLAITNHPSAPMTFNMELDLRLFNTKSYTPNLLYNQEVSNYLPNEKGNLSEITFSVFGEDGETYLLKERELTKEKGVREFSEENIFNYLDNKIGENVKIGVMRPRESKAFVRYSNWLQVKMLTKNFGINFVYKPEEMKLSYTERGDSIVGVETIKNIYVEPELKKRISEGRISLANMYGVAEEENGLLSSLKELRDNIIAAMLLSNKATYFYYKDYTELFLPTEVVKLIRRYVGEVPLGESVDKTIIERRKINYLKLKEYLFKKPDNMSGELELKESELLENEIAYSFNSDESKINVNKLHPTEPITTEFVNPLYNGKISLKGGNRFIVKPNSETIYSSIKNNAVRAIKEGTITFYENTKEIVIQIPDLGQIKYIGVNTPTEFKNYYKKNQNVRKGSIIGYLENASFEIELSEKLMSKLKGELLLNEVRNVTKEDTSLLKRVRDYFQNITRNANFYASRLGVENILVKTESIGFEENSIRDIEKITGVFIEAEDALKDKFRPDSNTIITSVSGQLRNIVPSIPIVGLEYPTHQFMGSIEPAYQINFVSNNNLTLDSGNEEFRLKHVVLEKMRANSQYYSKMFPEIPNAGQIAIDTFITRVLGSFDVESLYLNEEGGAELNNNIIIESLDTFTIEGVPGSAGLNLRVLESKSYEEEKISPAYTNYSNSNLNKELMKIIQDDLDVRFAESKKGNSTKTIDISKYSVSPKTEPSAPLITSEGNYNNIMDWNTKYFNSEMFYAKEKRVRGTKNVEKWVNDFLDIRDGSKDSKSADYIAWVHCKYLSKIQDILNHYISPYDISKKKGYSILLYSTTRTKNDNFYSNHHVGSATDLLVPGMNVMEFATILRYLYDEKDIKSEFKNFLGIGLYGIAADNIDVKMGENINNAGARGFVHLDENFIVEGNNYRPPMITRKRSNHRFWVGKHRLDVFNISAPSFWNSATEDKSYQNIKNKISVNIDLALNESKGN